MNTDDTDQTRKSKALKRGGTEEERRNKRPLPLISADDTDRRGNEFSVVFW
jgi:hypothetical protein